MANAIALHTGDSISRHEPAGLRFTPEQEEMIREHYSTGASKSEFEVLMAVAKARRLNPLLRQVHFVKRWDNQKEKNIWAVQVSIDGLRAIAERTGTYDGQDEPEFEHDKNGRITVARVRVYKRGVSRPFVGVARWSEYVQTKRDGNPTKFWADMPYTMLAKCAEALAIRKAFPEDSGGLYVPEEMMQAENDRPPRINPHMDDDGFQHNETGAFEELSARLGSIESALPSAKSYDDALMLRELLGSKAKQSQLTKEIQAAGERNELSAEQRKELGKTWQRINRQVEKIEKAYPPPNLLESFRDEPDTDAPQPGDMEHCPT